MAFNEDEYRAEAEKMSDSKLHKLLALSVHDPKKVVILEDELRQRNQKRADELERRKEASQSEQIEIARSAKDAAWEAASAARDAAAAARDSADEARAQSRIAERANTRAKIAIVIAAIATGASLIMAIVSLIDFLSKD